MLEKGVIYVEYVKIIYLWCLVWKGVDKVDLFRVNFINLNKVE